MKKLFMALGLFILCTNVSAQFPPSFTGMKYQAVARDASGNPIANQTISLEFEIFTGGPSIPAYSETTTATTNEHGLFSVVIGEGIVPIGFNIWDTFEEIKWDHLNPDLIVYADFNDGNGLQYFGSEDIKTVPYASLAHEAMVLKDSAWIVANSPDRVYNTGFDVGIGTSTPNAKLHVEGDVRIADGTEGDGKVLTSDVDGNASWATMPTVSAGTYTTTWTTVSGFTSDPSTRTCEYSQVGSLVTVVCRFGGTGPSFSGGTNEANITVPPGLNVASVPGGQLISGMFASDHYRNGTDTEVGIVSHLNATSVRIKINGSNAGIAGSWCSFSYKTSAP